MNITEYIDLVLFVAMAVDLFIRHRRFKKVKHQMPKWKRYQYNATKLRNVIYGIILTISVAYVLFRLYNLMTAGNWIFPRIMILVPCIDYYIIWDLLYAGIYYNKNAIYYKNELYEFRRALHIYRYKVKNRYEYEMTYRNPDGGQREIVIKVPDEKEAYPLLMCIPFEEEDEA